jgi:multiple sugar transport system substrate-binding protein
MKLSCEKRLNDAILIHAFIAIFFMVPPCLFAGEQAERAITAVEKLINSGKVDKNAVIRLVAKQGNINNFWGEDFELKREWEQRTGISIDAAVMPQLPVLEYLRANKDFDLTVARQREYPDLFVEGLIVDLTPLIKKYSFQLDDNPTDGFIIPKSQTDFNGKVIAIPADGDIAILYLRQDLMEDSENKAKFKQLYHRDLKLPSTWDEYQDLIAFFHDPERGFYGSCEQRDPQTGWMFWMPRYVSQASPNQFLFDEKMHPLVNSKAGVDATNSYLKTIAFSPPHILEDGNHYNYTLPIYRRGDAFAHIITMALAKMLNLESSPIRGKFMCALMPGTVVGDKLIRRTSFIYGNNIVVSSSSKQKELGLLFAMWISDPDISTRSITVTTGIADPYRFNHLNDPQAQLIYTKQALESLGQNAKIAVPAGTGLPGDNEYIMTLNKYLWAAAKGEITAQEAMDKTAKQWNQITDNYGRDKQIHYWRNFREKFPQTTFPIPGS